MKEVVELQELAEFLRIRYRVLTSEGRDIWLQNALNTDLNQLREIRDKQLGYGATLLSATLMLLEQSRREQKR